MSLFVTTQPCNSYMVVTWFRRAVFPGKMAVCYRVTGFPGGRAFRSSEYAWQNSGLTVSQGYENLACDSSRSICNSFSDSRRDVSRNARPIRAIRSVNTCETKGAIEE